MDSDAFLGEIRLFAGDYAPDDGWLICDGSLQTVSQYSALFSLIGITYGGDGVNKFALPDLRGRVAVDVNSDLTSQPFYKLGAGGGSEGVVMAENVLPNHTHTLSIATTQATSLAPTPDNTMAIGAGASTAPLNLYTTTKTLKTPGLLGAQTIRSSGVASPAAHNNMMPSLVLSYMICVEGGIFPAAQ